MQGSIRMCCATAAAVPMLILASAVASADDFEGRTYGDAADDVSSWGGTPVVASVTGNQLDLRDCVVTSSKQSHETNRLGRKTWGEYLFHLNCNARIAGEEPGNSAMSPAGRKAQQERETARWLQTKLDEDSRYCDGKAWCVAICERTGLCTVPN